MSSAHDQPVDGVPEILEHEMSEAMRIQAFKTSCAQKEDDLRKKFATQEDDIEAEARSVATAELRVFSEKEMPRILEAGESARLQAVSDVEAHAKKAVPPTLKATVQKACTGCLAL